METHENPAFIGDDGRRQQFREENIAKHNQPPIELQVTNESPPSEDKPERDLWGKDIEFLLSCIAMSVGLGNVWRFPFTALENGGGAFLIPYLIVLFLVGKPIYYLEMIMGQFSSRGAVKVYDMCPAMRGIGIGQVISIAVVTTYYASLMGMTLVYFFQSFRSVLPWSVCHDEWNALCISSGEKNTSYFQVNLTSASVGFGQSFAVFLLCTYYASIMGLICRYLVESFKSPLPWVTCLPVWFNCINSTNYETLPNLTYDRNNTGYFRSSSELYFVKEILKEVDTLDNGIGLPNWELVLGLVISWAIVYIIIIKGVKSSGKASYFLAIFPYVVLGILLVRALTLEGSLNGIIYFIKPQWGEILNPKVWYAAVTQVFFSLSVCFGNIIMYSSFNKFNHNVYKDATIVTLLDTFTSLLAGCTIFGILGHLAHEIGTHDVGSVVKGGTGLAFISYPDAIAKFEKLPQAFSVLFFAMLFVLGVGSNIAMTSCVMTSIRDNFPRVKHWHAALVIVLISIAIGIVYVTPGGQFILNLVDYFGASMIALVLAIAELVVVSWIYGVRRVCKDAEFMIGKNPGWYWRICWGIVTPLLMGVILIYTFVSYEPLTYRDIIYPDWGYALGWTIAAIGILQLPIWAGISIMKQPGTTILEKVRSAFKPSNKWGPADPVLRERYKKFMSAESDDIFRNTGIFARIKRNIFD